MPVIPVLSQAVEIGLNFMPAAPPEVVATVKQMAQIVLVSPSLQAMVPPIPVIPAGAPVTYALMLIEAMLFKLYEIINQIIIQMQNQYSQQLEKALNQREEALEELYQAEIEAQELLIEEVQELRDIIAQLEIEIQELERTQKEELALYQAELVKIKEEAIQAHNEGNLNANQEAEEKVQALEPWLDEIIKMIIEITNKKIEKIQKDIELDLKLPLSTLNLVKEWTFLETYADGFEVAIPYYPDLPDEPNFPVLPPIPQIPEKVKAFGKAFAKWATGPQLPPLGILVATALKEINAMVPKDPITGAQLDSIPDALNIILGGAI